jgi:hypothetical protein
VGDQPISTKFFGPADSAIPPHRPASRMVSEALVDSSQKGGCIEKHSEWNIEICLLRLICRDMHVGALNCLWTIASRLDLDLHDTLRISSNWPTVQSWGFRRAAAHLRFCPLDLKKQPLYEAQVEGKYIR